MGKAELEKLLGVSSTPRRKERENNNHKIIVFRKKLPNGNYMFSCRGYKKISADRDFPLNRDFKLARDFAFACRIVDVK